MSETANSPRGSGEGASSEGRPGGRVGAGISAALAAIALLAALFWIRERPLRASSDDSLGSHAESIGYGLVVLGAGDEMSLSFRVPKNPVPPGWKRDFFLKNVGWDKDCNVNTVYGDSVEPLPFRGMKSYPSPPGVLRPNSARYREYLRTYQTRTQQSARFWQRIRRFPPLNSAAGKSFFP